MTVDALREAGLERMDDTAVRDFLSGQRVGVLGLPTEGAPYLVPLSFGYDGEGALYFTYVGGADSRKRILTDRADAATVLVYSVDSMFNWESVVLSGHIEAVPEPEWDDLQDVLGSAWRPELFETAIEQGEMSIYRFRIDEQVGIKHTGLPPGFGDV